MDGTLIPVGPISALKDPRRVEDAVAEETGEMPPYYSRASFRPVVNALLRLAELGRGSVAGLDHVRVARPIRGRARARTRPRGP